MDDYNQFMSMLAGTTEPAPGFLALVAVLAVWDVAWKGVALWKAARNGSTPWFIALLLINSVGILPIIYIFFFAQKKKHGQA